MSAASSVPATPYGHFSENCREYVITRPDTPRPWFNYLFNDRFHAIISQGTGGFSYYIDPKYNRLIRYDHISSDQPGRYLYIRDLDSQDVWTPTWQPMRKPLDAWECRHGLGYTVISSKYQDIETEITYFVPSEDPVELWLVKVRNTGQRQRKLRLFPFAELLAGDASMELSYRNIMCLYNEAAYDPSAQAIVAFKHQNPSRPVLNFTFFGSSLPVSGHDCSREQFLGRYNDFGSPERIKAGSLANSSVRGKDMVAVLQSDVTLAPGAETEFVVVLGFAEQREAIAKVLTRYRDLVETKRQLQIVKDSWEQMTHKIEVETPDKSFDTMINIWGKYQLLSIVHWRGTSAYHGAEGGLGYRDMAQDVEGIVALDPALAIRKLELLFYYQYNSGHAVSGFSEVEGSWHATGASIVTGKADVAVWLPYTVVAYLKETGDDEFLEREFEFHDGGKATVYERIKRVVRYLYEQRGERGFPFIRKADWNDAYDSIGVKGKGESVWLAMALARACRQVGELAEVLNDRPVVEEMQQKYEELKRLINERAWDGDWYIAAINDDGMKIGSARQEEGRVPLNSLTWSILGDVVTPERLPKILDRIDNYLDTPYGPALFRPAYTYFQPTIGRVTAFAPGTKENAAVFSHACAFKIVADCELGRGNKAYETFAKLMPTSPVKVNNMELYKVEPYVWAEFVYGPDHPDAAGEGSFTWNTGTSPWMFLAATEWMLGARRDFRGLRIDPCLPSHWEKARIRRPFRGATYDITIENPDRVEHGVREIYVDGKKLEGNLIVPHSDGRVHQVRVVMGAGAKSSAAAKAGHAKPLKELAAR